MTQPYSLKNVEDFIDKLIETYCVDELRDVYREMSKPATVAGHTPGRLLVVGWGLLSPWEKTNSYLRLHDLIFAMGKDTFKRYAAIARECDQLG